MVFCGLLRCTDDPVARVLLTLAQVTHHGGKPGSVFPGIGILDGMYLFEDFVGHNSPGLFADGPALSHPG